MKPTFFATQAKLRAWLEQHHATARELLAFFQAQPPWHRKTATWWVIRAKRDETRLKRLATLIDDSEHGRTIRQLTRPGS